MNLLNKIAYFSILAAFSYMPTYIDCIYSNSLYNHKTISPLHEEEVGNADVSLFIMK